jgi:hypothetical protein
VFASNRQFDSDGILVQNVLSVPSASCHECTTGVFANSAVEIRDNLIEGEYDYADDCSSSGIQLSVGASPASPLATMSYGLLISRNVVRSADSEGGGAIAIRPTWYVGPSPHDWPLVDRLVIDSNSVSVPGGRAKPCHKGAAHPRAAMSLPNDNLFRHLVIAGNSCPDASVPLLRKGVAEVIACAGFEPACGCALPGGER